MRREKARAVAGLAVVTSLLAAAECVPIAARHFTEARGGIYALRARLRGASFKGRAGVVMQASGNDCGPACLKMVLADRGIERTLEDLASDLRITARGTSLFDLRLVAWRSGVPARSWVIDSRDLDRVPLPAIAFVNGDHFVVVRRFVGPEVLEIDDPALGKLVWPLRRFAAAWRGETLVFDPEWTPM